jgi:uncharacterized protein YbjT (DUF2867 family)
VSAAAGTDARRHILVTGASGYVGGRLVRALAARGERLRCLARRPASLAGRFGAEVELVRGDVLAADSLAPALSGIDTAFYLVHSMGADGDFEEDDRRAARNFAAAARAAGVRRIVYLGGLGDERADLSPHLRSRHEVGRLLADSGVPVLELRASIVLGAGSLSFEMIRALVERLPVMITPRWVGVEAQPIGIDDLVAYLVQALDVPLPESRIVEIGGPERVSYGGLMREYARQRGLRRALIRVPVLTPRLSGLWLGLVTPLYARVGRKLVESIVHPTVVRSRSARELFDVTPMSVSTAIARALKESEAEVLTRWCDAVSAGCAPPDWSDGRFGPRLVDARSVRLPVAPEHAFEPIQRIGGTAGWYAYDWLWTLRGALDLAVGGVGVRRGRAHPVQLRVGDALDFWRVEAFEPGRRLLLAAEMKLPGRAWLELAVEPDGPHGASVRQTALFDPVGLGGLAYWHALRPLHALVFAGLLRGIARRALAAERAHAAPGAVRG